MFELRKTQDKTSRRENKVESLETLNFFLFLLFFWWCGFFLRDPSNLITSWNNIEFSMNNNLSIKTFELYAGGTWAKKKSVREVRKQ